MYNAFEFKILAAAGIARALGQAVYVLELGGRYICSPVGAWLTCAVPVRAYKALVDTDGTVEYFN